MPRKETKIMNNWEFALEKDGEKHFQTVDLPHDWAITAPFSREMAEGEAQGFRDRWGVGWYRKRFILPEALRDKRILLDFGGV